MNRVAEITVEEAALSWFKELSYAIAHAPALIIFLVWLFVRHRDRYPVVRNTVALVTGVCLCMHFVPAAPPRLFPELGFVDTAKVYEASPAVAGTAPAATCGSTSFCSWPSCR